MAAGESALRRAVELEEDADALFALSQELRIKAKNYVAASSAERDLAGLLRPLDQLGWTVLEDRLWPGSKRANVDFILVGPGGVVVVDSKTWAEVEIRDGALFRGQSREDDEISKLTALVDSLAEGLSQTGLTCSSIRAAMVFSGRRLNSVVGPVSVLGDADVATWLSRLRARLTPEQIVEVAAAVSNCCPPIASTGPCQDVGVQRSDPVPQLAEIVPPALIDADELTTALLDTALAGPIEDWMTFLHPEQNKLVRSQWNGPARIRGPAGTGKTVVGLHRAVYLARRARTPVLFVSFVKTLPVIMAALAERLSPESSGRMDFVGVHKLAYRCLDRVNEKVRLDSRGADRVFANAWLQTASARRLRELDERPSYWKEEIDWVIKGRGISDFPEYRDLQRVGRKTPMRAEDRAAMWDLYAAYESGLEALGIEDFNDLLIRAKSAVERYPALFAYSAVIVDEAQDLNLLAVAFLKTLAGDGPNNLLVIGDGQQSVYPGGYTLSEAGITVAGRATVLGHNYRNTREILEEARRLVSADTFEDLDGIAELGAREAVATRRGYPPLRVTARTQRDIDVALTRQIHDTRDRLATPWGHMAVLAERTRAVEHYQRVLSAASIPWVALTDYDGTSTDRVKVGTIKRAKGLEFTYVLLPGLSQTPPGIAEGESADSYAERVERWRRELYVAMTRARDGLWLGYIDPEVAMGQRSRSPHD